jgi:hypothetical protein
MAGAGIYGGERLRAMFTAMLADDGNNLGRERDFRDFSCLPPA